MWLWFRIQQMIWGVSTSIHNTALTMCQPLSKPLLWTNCPNSSNSSMKTMCCYLKQWAERVKQLVRGTTGSSRIRMCISIASGLSHTVSETWRVEEMRWFWHLFHKGRYIISDKSYYRLLHLKTCSDFQGQVGFCCSCPMLCGSLPLSHHSFFLFPPFLVSRVPVP